MSQEKKSPLISVCIPAYNRPGYTRDLLETIAVQDFDDYEVIVCEDNSPLTKAVEAVVAEMQGRYPARSFRFIRNEKTLGYDGNFRGLLSHARGEYCVYMGDDDLLCPGALRRIASVIERNPGVGVIIRSWAKADRDSKEVLEEFRYFDGDRYFEPGRSTVATLYRRSVQIAGYTINRRYAEQFATNQFDGTLLYQLYLTGMVTYAHGGYYIADRIAIMRKDANQKPTHFFGNAEAEKGRFRPGELSTDISVNFIEGMIRIAGYLADHYRDPKLRMDLIRDIDNYSFPLFSVQRDKPVAVFVKYFFSLRALGLGGTVYFYLYFLVLLLMGRRYANYMIVFIKKVLGKTPAIGRLDQGKLVATPKQ
ncbi:MAG: glycosyltransferase family 2 protein [Gallionella sp.]|nr:glycosyltransferase family 2 protein [Gallionella sp.]